MADLTQITLPSGTTYDLVDAGARELISEIQAYSDYLGVTTTALTDGATTNPITIGGESVTAKKGNIANYGSAEFIFNGTEWQLFGDLSALGSLAYKNSASGRTTPAGSVSQPTFTGTQGNVSVSGTPSGSVTISVGTGTANYTPAGSVSKPNITVTPSTTTVNSITAVGSLPSLTFTVSNKNLTIGWSAGSLPTKGSNTTVMTGASAALAAAPTFTGTGAQLTASFSGNSLTSSGNFTPSGTVSKPNFTGTEATVTVS